MYQFLPKNNGLVPGARVRQVPCECVRKDLRQTDCVIEACLRNLNQIAQFLLGFRESFLLVLRSFRCSEFGPKPDNQLTISSHEMKSGVLDVGADRKKNFFKIFRNEEIEAMKVSAGGVVESTRETRLGQSRCSIDVATEARAARAALADDFPHSLAHSSDTGLTV